MPFSVIGQIFCSCGFVNGYSLSSISSIQTVDYDSLILSWYLPSWMNPPQSLILFPPQYTHISNLSWTMAHELGHSLGMGHDKRDCYCSAKQCVMFGRGKCGNSCDNKWVEFWEHLQCRSANSHIFDLSFNTSMSNAIANKNHCTSMHLMQKISDISDSNNK